MTYWMTSMRNKENFHTMVGETNYSNDNVNIEFIKVGNSVINRVTIGAQSVLTVECVAECFAYMIGSSLKVNGDPTIMGDAGYIEGVVTFDNDQMWPMEFIVFGKIKVKEE